jgi:hypothetical protein
LWHVSLKDYLKDCGYAYRKLNKISDAKADFEMALKYNPSIDVPVEKNNTTQIVSQQKWEASVGVFVASSKESESSQ